MNATVTEKIDNIFNHLRTKSTPKIFPYIFVILHIYYSLHSKL